MKQLNNVVIFLNRNIKNNFFVKKIVTLLHCCIVIWLFFGTKNSYSQVATATTKEKEFLIGDWIPIELNVVTPIGAKVYFPNLKDSISENIEIANATPIDTVKSDGQYTYHQLINLIVFDTGKIILPRFQIGVESKGNLDTLITEAILVHIAGVKIDTSKAIQPIKAPLKVPYTFKEILPYLLIIFGLIIALFLIWYFIKKQKNKAPILDEKYTLPPHIWAIQELQKLQTEKVWQSGNVKEYWVRLTDIGRSYIELRYKVPAMESTTEDLMKSLHKGIVKQSLLKPINEVLTTSDFVKFAKAQPDFLENENAIQVIKDFVEKTKPKEEKPTK